jgi:hypothetical protein
VPEPATLIRYQIGATVRKTYWRRASVVMAAIMFNATQDRTAANYFVAGWTRRWWGAYVLTIHERFVSEPDA